MVIDKVGIDPGNQQPVVVLKEESSSRYLPISIGPDEANAIIMKLQEVEPPRPMSHDLICSIIKDLGAEATGIVINTLEKNIFYAEIILMVNGEEIQVDSRPSDALALAVRFQMPIFATESVLDRAGVWLDENTGLEGGEGKPATDDELRKMSAFTEFINTLDMDDFKSEE